MKPEYPFYVPPTYLTGPTHEGGGMTNKQNVLKKIGYVLLEGACDTPDQPFSSESPLQLLQLESDESYHYAQPSERPLPRREVVTAQNKAEATYALRHGTADRPEGGDYIAYRIETHGPNDKLSGEQIASAMEYDHVVKSLPTLTEQSRDTSRTNRIFKTNDHACMTEYEALRWNVDLLRYASRRCTSKRNRRMAESLLHATSYIGRKEYMEAAQGIAVYWKSLLDSDPDMKLYVISSGVTSSHSSYGTMKSDRYLFNAILGNFSNSQLEAYAGRLVEQSTSNPISPLKGPYRIILLDDWIISGSQLHSVALGIMDNRDSCIDQSRIEVHNVVATPQRIAIGLETNIGFNTYRGGDLRPIVRSYYLAHVADQDDAPKSGAHISGSHSSVDFDFEYTMNEIINDTVFRGREGIDSPVTNLRRIYRAAGFPTKNIARFYAATAAHAAPEERSS